MFLGAGYFQLNPIYQSDRLLPEIAISFGCFKYGFPFVEPNCIVADSNARKYGFGVLR